MTHPISILLLTLLCAGCGYLHPGSSAGPFGSAVAGTSDVASSITPPLPDSAPVIQSMMAPLVSVPPPPTTNIFIPLHWPEDWMNYSWQVFASSNLLDWKLVVTNVDMSAESIDVPSMGFEKGFYKLSPFATNQ